MSDKTSDKLLPCPFCGGEAYEYRSGFQFSLCEIICKDCGCRTERMTVEDAITAWNTRKPMKRYEELEEKLQSVYGECDGLLEKVVEGLVKHEGAEFEKPMKARLLTDEDVDKWDRLKGAMERILERLEELREAEYDDSDEEPEYRDFDDVFEDGVSSGKFKAYHKAIEIVKEEMS